MSFSTYFRASSYAMLACGALALVMAGGMSLALAVLLTVVLGVTWRLEGTRWQLSERAGLAVVLLSLPLFYFDWHNQTGGVWGAERAGAGINALTHFILFLSAVKLWQVKADRDWLFLYLISFFEVLLAAGLSVSPYFLGTLALYMFCALSTVVCFEIKRARARLRVPETHLLGAPRPRLLRRLRPGRGVAARVGEARRLALVAFCLLALIFTLALPIFFITPRAGANALSRADGGVTGLVGFADEVTIGEIGQLQRSNQIVMRVRVDDAGAARRQPLYWRGVALDQFDGRAWRRTRGRDDYVPGGEERSLFQFDTTESLARLTTQTFYIEPVDTAVMFIAPRAIAVQGALPYVRRDTEGGLTTRPHTQERITYRAYSDTNVPPAALLRADAARYPREWTRYLTTPPLDPRVAQLTREVLAQAQAGNHYDAARAVERYLRSGEFTYTLDLKAGGADPLADFLFNVRAGHCEYFATAMAMMLRTTGIATRVVNGFQQGEYNDAADAYTVRQADAHSWVEVYFPATDSWVMFDPTPAEGRPGGAQARGWLGGLRKYGEALELFWIQYVVAYDKQEQRSLAATVRAGLSGYRQTAARMADRLRTRLLAWWQALTTGNPQGGSLWPPLGALVVLLAATTGLLLLLLRRLRGLRFGRARPTLRPTGPGRSAVAFYERMCQALATRGLRRAADQTPLEFAAVTALPEVLFVTTAYNRVRFGARDLSPTDAGRVEAWLRSLEGNETNVPTGR